MRFLIDYFLLIKDLELHMFGPKYEALYYVIGIQYLSCHNKW